MYKYSRLDRDKDGQPKCKNSLDRTEINFSFKVERRVWSRLNSEFNIKVF